MATPAARDRGATEERLLAAVGTVLARDGFGAIGVNAVAREAGVDKVLIYRYFDGLPGLLRAWGRSGRFWPSVDELLAARPGLLDLPAAQRWSAFFDHFIDALRARPLTLEVMAAEIVERNELTAILEEERERWGEQAFAMLGGPEMADRPHLRHVTLLLVAGVQHLLLRSRRIRLFGRLDLHRDADWAALKQSIAVLAGQVLPP
ncbi:MAG: TetR/AcrR family transcriptional regulator [Burkholderiaceae bacterium]|nr:TetR/AcrR family transcriptional regulator [Burkholderiaceae bacterium]